MANQNHYEILGVNPSASFPEIRTAYKKAALKYHPDRVPNDSPERPSLTRKFQQVNDAYYTLSEPRRRREYDASRPRGPHPRRPQPKPGPKPESKPEPTFESTAESEPQPGAYSKQFEDIFEEMLREEGMMGDDEQTSAYQQAASAAGAGHFWSIVGGLSGAGLGFIIANFPGLLAGVVLGNRLGAIRDRKKMSVYEVFQQLPQSDRAKLLSSLAARVLQSAVS
ncbi:hypothetical protein FQN57_007137 [Myotisia sp. PD_48]|nr:hypothetical protein FQN57_007137 [Myotisia sp. PD_48]